MTPEDEEFNRIERESDMRTKAVSAALIDHAAFVSEYIKGFNAGVDCVLTEIKRLEKTGPVSLQQLLKHLDPKRDEKTPQKTEKASS
jgi:hypothetical protein